MNRNFFFSVLAGAQKMLRKNPLKRSGKPMRRTPLISKSALQPADKPLKARKRLKTKRPAMTPIKRSARGESCTLQFTGVCCGNNETTVWAHSNLAQHGKGIGIKAADEYGCYACWTCHAWLDGGYAGKVARETVEAVFLKAMAISRMILVRKGLLSVNGITAAA